MSTTDSVLNRGREIEPIIRQYAAATENDCKLAAPVAKAMQEPGLYRLWRSKAFEEFGAELVIGLRVIEEISRIDGAAGWNLPIAVAHDMFAPWFGDQAARDIRIRRNSRRLLQPGTQGGSGRGRLPYLWTHGLRERRATCHGFSRFRDDPR
ncbi:acyl-CoA dehydrogenase family protein [Methylocaldum szegediense]|uniref:Uncharacterized protein n=1 Tax=Methylocaldum szegediense TaxID=73780 RepID=A0ABM9I4U8_9GAMM|nr:hypothetical protein [Methylocaldum szegediense]CAI8894161.1 protein of unknown function [Methylocaldum szegediense]